MVIHGIPASAFGLLLLGGIQLLALAWALYAAPWRQLLAVPARMHLAGGAMVVLVLLWSARAIVDPAIEIHLLGATAVTLMLGLPLTLLVGSLAQLMTLLLGQSDLSSLLPQALLNVTLPALLTTALLHAMVRLQWRNLFVYLLGLGFGGAAAAALLAHLSLWLLLLAEGHGLPQWPASILLLLCFQEGFINGTVVSLLAVYKPHWMKTFDDRYFLGRRPQP